MSDPTPPAVSDAMREAVAPVTRAEVRACIGPTIPLRRRWVDLLMRGPIARLHAEIARLTGEREAEKIERQVAETEVLALREERDAARATNRELHRRLQAAEGPTLARAVKAERAAEFWLRQRKEASGRIYANARRAEAAEAETARLRAALEPFVAEACRIYAVETVEEIGDRVQVWQSGGFPINRSHITYGDLRRAHAALSSQEQADV